MIVFSRFLRDGMNFSRWGYGPVRLRMKPDLHDPEPWVASTCRRAEGVGSVAVKMPASQRDKQDGSRISSPEKSTSLHPGRRKTGGKALSVVVAGSSAYLSLRAANHWWLVLRRKLLRDIFMTVVPILNEMKVEYWADFGTLLGLFREGDLILHDNDVDIVLLNPAWDVIIRGLRRSLAKKAYHIKVTKTTDKETGKQYTWVRVWGLFGAFADLYSAELCNGDEMIKLYNEGLKIPKSFVLPTHRMDFKGLRVNVPCNVEGVLEYRYGDDYMVPKYMDKGRDEEENNMRYAKILRAVGKLGFRFY